MKNDKTETSQVGKTCNRADRRSKNRSRNRGSRQGSRRNTDTRTSESSTDLSTREQPDNALSWYTRYARLIAASANVPDPLRPGLKVTPGNVTVKYTTSTPEDRKSVV